MRDDVSGAFYYDPTEYVQEGYEAIKFTGTSGDYWTASKKLTSEQQ